MNGGHCRGKACRVKYSRQMPFEPLNYRRALLGVAGAVLFAWCVGMFARGYWTPDEPREADIAWRMSWQADKAVPLLAGEAYCEKPPLTYWLAAIPIKYWGTRAWVARLPNLLYAIITALAVGLLASRSAGRFAGLVAAATVSTFLLSYQVAIWLATDAPLLAATSVALLGAYTGFYASGNPVRLRGYLLMHCALAFGFLSKSAVAWMVPALAILTLSLWEKRWRELIRWELHAGLLIQALLILSWVWLVYRGNQGVEHLKVFFWNNLVGRFTAVDAPPELQYAAAHRNSPGKYLIELPVYLFPWTFLVIAAAHRAWRQRGTFQDNRAVRFALASSLPSLLVLSVAATARNIYLAPALPGFALLVGWWAREILPGPNVWEVRAIRATAVLLLIGAAVFVAALSGLGLASWPSILNPPAYIGVSLVGLSVAAVLAIRAWAAARDQPGHAHWALCLAYCSLLIGPASQAYRQIDTWQDLAQISGAVRRDADGRPLVLLAPDETTRAIIDMYATTSVQSIPGPLDSIGIGRVQSIASVEPGSLFLLYLPTQSALRLPWRGKPPQTGLFPRWLPEANLRIQKTYSLPNGRRYALLEVTH